MIRFGVLQTTLMFVSMVDALVLWRTAMRLTRIDYKLMATNTASPACRERAPLSVFDRLPGPGEWVGPSGKLLFIALIFIFQTLAGCGGDSDNAGADTAGDLADGSTGGTPVVPCTKDEATLATLSLDCRNNQHCPCGSHCRLGQCAFDCLSDDECPSGQGCDDWGLCRIAHNTTAAPPVLLDPSPALSVTPPYLRLVDKNLPRTVRINGLGPQPGPIRVQPSSGLWVRCAPTGEWTQTACEIDAKNTAVEMSVAIKADPAADPDQVHEVWVFYGNSTRSVGVALSDTPLASAGWPLESEEPTDEPAPPSPGVYEGHAWITATGAGDTTNSDPLVPEDFRIPITVLMYASPSDTSWTAVLQDPTKLISPQGEWVGTLTADGQGAWTWALPTQRTTDAPSSSDAPEVLQTGTALGVAFAGGLLEALLTIDYPGILIGADPIRATFQISVRKSRDLSSQDGDAPAVPPPVTSSYPSIPDRMITPLGWEIPVTTTPLLGPGATIPSVMATLNEVIIPNPSSLYPCERESFDAELTALLQIVCDAYWQSSSAHAPLAAAGLDGGIATYCGSFTHGAAIPCAIAITKAEGNPDNTPFPPGFNECDNLANEFGCTVENPANPSQTTLWAPNNVPTADFAAPKVCTFSHLTPSAKPGWCASRTLCFTPHDDPDAASLVSGEWSGSPLPTSGDLQCKWDSGDVGAPLGFGLFTNADQPAEGLWDGHKLPRKSGEMVVACIADLERFFSEPPQSSDVGGIGLAALFQSEGCLDGPRMLRALSAGLTTDRQRVLGKTAAVSESGSAVAHRVLQQWLHLHTYLVRETLQARTLAETLALGPAAQTRVATFPDIPSLVTWFQPAWSLLLHPRFAVPLANLPAEVVTNPDYRPHFTAAPLTLSNDYEQPQGVPTAMLNLYQAQLEVTLALLERAQFLPSTANVETARAAVETSMRLFVPVVALANRIRGQVDGPVPWEWGWKSAKSELNMAVKMVLTRMEQLELGDNPLGIEDRDLPIYFYGDPAGASAQFSAISDYLVGDGTGQGEFTAWAAATVTKAQDALDAARAAWLETIDRDLAYKLQTSEYEGQMDDVKGNYAGTILELCGAPQYDLNDPPEVLIDKWSQYSAHNCWLVGSADGEDPSPCVQTPENMANTLIQQLPTDDLAYRLCFYQHLRQSFGNQVSPYGTPALDYLAKFATGSAKIPVFNTADQTVTVEFETGGKKALTIDEFLTLLFRDPAVRLDLAETQTARIECAEQFPEASPLLALSELVSDPLDKAECYRGSVGETALAVRSAAKDVEIARSQLSELSDSFDIAMKACILQQAGNETMEQALAAHNKTMSHFKAGKLAADLTAIVAGGVKDAMVSYATGIDPVSKTFGGVAAAASMVETAATGVAAGLEFAMDKAQTEFDQTMTILENDISEQVCFTEAQANLVGAKTAALEVQRAMQELSAASLALSNGIVTIDGNLWCAPIQIERLMNRTVLPLTHTMWLDERLRAYQRAFRIAQRTLYLGVRAIEYEYQTSLAQRENVLSAKTPGDLQTILSTLWAESASRTIDGKKPKTGHFVVSLRNDLLHVQPDISLGKVLADPARRGTLEDGQVGQKIEFVLRPGAGDTAGVVEVFAAADCAERLWFTSAILTGEGLYEGDDRTFVNIQLRQQNTFFSQWCTGKGDGSEFQDVSVRPSRNLFRDPIFGTDAVTAQATSSETLSYTTARLDAYLNQTRADLEAGDYAQGTSGELAGRGLYGRYELFFPAAILYGTDSAGKSTGKGLRLDRVDDIFIRFDYVSVAK